MSDGKTPFLTIKISTPIEDQGPDVSIHWKDAPEMQHEWDDVDQAWTKISNGIHALIANLGPFPEGGYEIEFECGDYKLIVEENLTLEEYRNHGKED